MSDPSGADGVARLNSLPAEVFVTELMSCCAVTEWAQRLAARRPVADLDALRAAAAAELATLDWTQVLLALAAHPRIGERAAGTNTEAAWSRAEQSASATEDERAKTDLIAANIAYERRFEHVFLICANGLSHSAILAAARARLANDEHTERTVVRDELGKIVDLRIRKLVAE